MTVSTSFERFGGLMAVLAACSALIYAIAFVVLRNILLNSACLLLLGVFALPAVLALYYRLRDVEGRFALLALLLGTVGAIGSAIHGAYDLANAINPPDANVLSQANLPSQIDPRGFLTFGITSLGLLFVSWLMMRGGSFPRGLQYTSWLLAVLLLVIYLGRLIILDATHPAIVIPVLISGFIVSPLWYLWLGISLWQGPRTAVPGSAPSVDVAGLSS